MICGNTSCDQTIAEHCIGCPFYRPSKAPPDSVVIKRRTIYRAGKGRRSICVHCGERISSWVDHHTGEYRWVHSERLNLTCVTPLGRPVEACPTPGVRSWR